MAGQEMHRREVLRIMAIGASASQFGGFSRWVYGHDHAARTGASAKPDPYQPQFFEPDEYATLERLTELIIPSDNTPGAHEAGVSEFIDFIVASDDSVQYPFRTGLTWLDAHSIRLHGQAFRKLAENDQREILDALAYPAQNRPGEEDGREFFRLVREYSTMGYYTSKVGMEALDVPSLKTAYPECPGCPHGDDPEHLHLPPPKY
jgi:Gluconate 2-dehydrogenase subunit 3